MPRKRDPRRDEAFEMFRKANGDIKNRDIAEQLHLSEKTIGSWKSKDKWNQKLNGVLQTIERSTPNKKGAPKGNKNAEGNKGNSRASPPPGNKNALKTGEHETIFAEYLTEEEKDLYSNLDDDPFFIMSDEIRLLKIRQRRMMKRIADAEAGLTEKETEQLFELRGRKTLVESKKSGQKIQVEVPDLVLTEMKEHSFRKIDDLLSIEEALTRVSAQLQRAVKQLNELTLNENRKTLFDRQSEKLDVEIRQLKLQTGDLDPEEVGDDGFIDAIKQAATDQEVWGDDDNIET
nr:phage terminase small subunit [Enterococcus innesii]